MARGKHKVRATGKRSSQQDVAIRQLEAELALELEALAEAQGVLAEVAQLQREFGLEQDALASEVAPIADDLRKERDYLRSVASEMSAHHSRVHEAWNKYSSAAIDASEGRTQLEQIEAFGAAVGVPGFIADEKNHGFSAEAATRIQRARGERRSVSTMTHETQRHGELTTLLNACATGMPLIDPQYRQQLLEQGLVTLDEHGLHHLASEGTLSPERQQALHGALDLSRRIWNARAGELDPSTVRAWGSSPVVPYRSPGGVLESLGWIEDAPALAVEAPNDHLVAIGLPLPSTTAAARSFLASHGADRMLSAWRGTIESRLHVAKTLDLDCHPFAKVRPHPQPGQALATQTSYELAAYSHWLNDRDAIRWGQTAIGLSTSAAYWLPAGQTASFAESEPLSESDRAEMVLPFPNVFLAFAEPLLLERTETPSAEDRQRWEHLSQISHDALRLNQTIGGVIESRGRGEDEDWDVPELNRMISAFGAQIEGVLLLGDSLGRPDDTFAWCLSIRGAYGVSLGRFVVPASRARTQYRDVIDNLTAVVAWAEWHEPDRSTELPLGIGPEDLEALTSTPAFKRDAKRAGAGIRVVNVGSTYRGGTTRRSVEAETDSHVTPHIRRGHWRRQRFGPRLEGSKRIRIAPVLVNAHRGDVAPRVYRLRQRAVANPASSAKVQPNS